MGPVERASLSDFLGRDVIVPFKVNLADHSDSELVELQSHSNRWFGRTARRLLQERAANRELDADAVARAQDFLRGQDDDAAALAGLWILHMTGNLASDDYELALSHPSDVVRAWAVQLATEGTQASVSAETLMRLAESDPSPAVRLALAAALPTLASETRWRIGSALAGHGEDADDRFLPKMIWYGIAEVATTNAPRAMQLAESTPLTILADSIYWYLAREPEGRNQLANLIAVTPDDAPATRQLMLLHHGLVHEAKLPMPNNWREVQRRFTGIKSPEAESLCNELSALFGDAQALASYRAILQDESASLPARRQALRVLKRVGDREAAPIYIELLDDRRLRADAIELVSFTSDAAAARKLLAVFANLDESERIAALNALTSRADFAAVLLDAVDSNSHR